MRMPDMKLVWRNAHSCVHFTLDTSNHECERWCAQRFCAYATIVHEAPGAPCPPWRAQPGPLSPRPTRLRSVLLAKLGQGRSWAGLHCSLLSWWWSWRTCSGMPGFWRAARVDHLLPLVRQGRGRAGFFSGSFLPPTGRGHTGVQPCQGCWNIALWLRSSPLQLVDDIFDDF